MVSITADLSLLSKEQRESVANFVLTFPSSVVEVEDDDVVLPCFALPSEVVEDIEEETTPEAAFSAVTEPAAPVLVPENNDRLDKNGLPWDERIHASSRAKNADGSWRAKRGVDDATVAQVEGELKALMAIPSAPVPPAPEPVEPIATTVVPPAPLPVPAAPLPPAPAADDRAAFVNLISRASSAIGAKTLTQEELTAAVTAVGVPSLPLLANRLDLVPQVAATVEAYISLHQ